MNELNKTRIPIAEIAADKDDESIEDYDRKNFQDTLQIVVTFIASITLSILLLMLSGYKLAPNFLDKFSKGDAFLEFAFKTNSNNNKKADEYVKYGEEEKTKLIDITNNYRLNHGLTKVKYNKQLAKSAQKHADDMFKRNYFSHLDPDGKNPYDRLGNNSLTRVGENIIMKDNTAEIPASVAFGNWLKSPPHLETINTNGWTEIGIGCKQGIRYNPKTQKNEPIIIWVQLFASKQ